MIATCIPHISFPHPAPGRPLIVEVVGSIEGVCGEGGELPSHLEDGECGVCMCMCVTVCESVECDMCVCVCACTRAKMSGVCM